MYKAPVAELVAVEALSVILASGVVGCPADAPTCNPDCENESEEW